MTAACSLIPSLPLQAFESGFLAALAVILKVITLPLQVLATVFKKLSDKLS